MPRPSRGFVIALALSVLPLGVPGVWAQAAQTAVSAAALRRIDLETHTPVRVLNRQELARLSHRGLGEALQRLPLIGGSAVNLNSNAGGDGSVTADIGGLGRARCIVMLNGHRLPVNELLGVPAVDLESIPLAAVERIEIFLGGASPAWGADAVAGVINIITRSEADGADLSVSSSMSSRGDADAHRASIFGGRVFGRGYLDGSVEYRKQDPLDSSARDFSSSAQALGCADGDNCLWRFGSTITPDGMFIVPSTEALDGSAGRLTVNPAGGYKTFVSRGANNDLYSTQGDTFLRAARTGVSVTARGGYEFSDRTHASFDVLTASDRSRRRLSALPLSTASNGAILLTRDSYNSLLPLRVSVDNFYNPFGADVFEVRRRLTELGARSLVDDSDVTFAAGALRHELDEWKLEGMASWGRSAVTEHISHVLRDDRIFFALGPSGPDAAGNIVCGSRNPDTKIVDEPIPDCVSLDVFHGPGSMTPEMLDYITTSRTDEARISQRQASFMARREIALGLKLPAQLALGVESRSLSARFEFPGAGFPLTFEDGEELRRSGTVDQQDLIGEVVLPFNVLDDGGGASTISLGGRLSRFESRATIGSGFAAITWRLDEDVLARGRFTQVYRAPSAGELFLGPRERVLPIGDLCSGVEPTISLLCGSSVFAVSVDALAEPTYFTAGNSDLRPERGYSASAGLVWNSPERRERFVALDATLTRLNDAIRAPGALELIAACQNSSTFNACQRLVTNSLGGAVAIDGSLINGGRDESARLDLEVRDGGVTRWGNWQAELFASYLLRRRLTDIEGNRLNLRGTFDITQSSTGVAYPTVEGQARLQWSRAPYLMEWSAQYIGSFDEVRDRNGWLMPTGGSLNSVNAVMYHDLSFGWSVRPSWNMRLNIENVFDREPPFVNNGFEANTDAPTYRLEGRLLSASIDVSF